MRYRTTRCRLSLVVPATREDAWDRARLYVDFLNAARGADSDPGELAPHRLGASREAVAAATASVLQAPRRRIESAPFVGVPSACASGSR